MSREMHPVTFYDRDDPTDEKTLDQRPIYRPMPVPEKRLVIETGPFPKARDESDVEPVAELTSQADEPTSQVGESASQPEPEPETTKKAPSKS